MSGQTPQSATFSNDHRRSEGGFESPHILPSTALLIEYYEGVATKGSNLPSVRVRVNPYSTESQQHSARTSYISPLPTRENTVSHHHQQQTEPEESGEYEPQQEEDEPASAGGL